MVSPTGVGSRGVCSGSDTPNYLCGGDIDMYIPPRKKNLIPSHANCMQHVLRCWEKQSDGSEFKKTLRRPGLRPGPRWGSLQRSRKPPSWWVGAGCPIPKNPIPRLSALRASPLLPPTPKLVPTPLVSRRQFPWEIPIRELPAVTWSVTSYLADGEAAVGIEVARLVRLESSLADLLAGRRTPAQPQQRRQLHLETLADGVDPLGGRRREVGRGYVQPAELGSVTHRVLRLQSVQKTATALLLCLAVYSSGNSLVSINAVALHWVRLVLEWVTAFGQVNYLTTYNQPLRPTSPSSLPRR